MVYAVQDLHRASTLIAGKLSTETLAQGQINQRLRLRYLTPKTGPLQHHKLATAQKEYKNSSDFYIYNRPPPHGWEGWLQYAREKRCVLEE